MHEALQALIDNAFQVLGLHRLEATIDPCNENSAISLRRLGFAFEGTQRERWIVDGQFTDSGMYALLDREWAELCASKMNH